MAFLTSRLGPRLFVLDWRNCGSAPLVRTTGARVDQTYWRKNGSCVSGQSHLSSEVELYAVGPVISPDRLPALRYQLEGSGRARRRILVGPGGVSGQAGWFDTQLKTECGLHEIEGRVRCLPRPPFGDAPINFSEFADAACTLPLAVEGDACPLPKYIWGRNPTVCPPRETLYTPRAERYAGTFFDRSGTSCTVEDISPPPTQDHVLDPAPLAGFPDLGPVAAPDASADR